MLRHKVQAVVIVAVLFVATASATLGLALLQRQQLAVHQGVRRAARRGRDGHREPGPGERRAARRDRARSPGSPRWPGRSTETTIPLEYQGQPWGQTTLVGRSAPGGPVDDLVLNAGHWADGPGQVVLAGNRRDSGGNGGPALGNTLTATSLPGKPVLTVVGFANSITHHRRRLGHPGRAVQPARGPAASRRPSCSTGSPTRRRTRSCAPTRRRSARRCPRDGPRLGLLADRTAVRGQQRGDHGAVRGGVRAHRPGRWRCSSSAT